MIEVKKDQLDIANLNQPVLLYFCAPWCAPCKAIQPHLASIDGKQVQVLKIDITGNPNTANQYKVQTLPTLVYLKDGKEVRRASGGMSLAQIQKLIQ